VVGYLDAAIGRMGFGLDVMARAYCQLDQAPCLRFMQRGNGVAATFVDDLAILKGAERVSRARSRFVRDVFTQPGCWHFRSLPILCSSFNRSSQDVEALDIPAADLGIVEPACKVIEICLEEVAVRI
jgi:hypothetical protein